MPGSGKTEAVKQVARLLDRTLFYVDFENLIDSKLGQTNKNIAVLFNEIYFQKYLWITAITGIIAIRYYKEKI